MIRTMTIVTAIVTNTAALLRFATRISLHQTMGLDDLFIAGAVVSYEIQDQENASNPEDLDYRRSIHVLRCTT